MENPRTQFKMSSLCRPLTAAPRASLGSLFGADTLPARWRLALDNSFRPVPGPKDASRAGDQMSISVLACSPVVMRETGHSVSAILLYGVMFGDHGRCGENVTDGAHTLNLTL